MSFLLILLSTYSCEIIYMLSYLVLEDRGASSIPCSLIYGGSHPFSERESTVVKRIVEDVKIDFISYLSFHSYGQYWMYPWAFTSDYPPDVEDLASCFCFFVVIHKSLYNKMLCIPFTYILYEVKQMLRLF